ncbi:hypothetical protein CP533_4538 [Ophiocordyceps camponoti-saundersi (nom. inval.)]|nr:hypothetical protein CP533_4538 [Ophiocordyceps camponoti-saundersi (nom. inval.)]
MSTVLESLNDAQRRAVTSNAPTVAILAGPGSGKTHTLTARVAWLVQQAGYKPCDIIIATFTVKAAREMKTRIENALGQELSSRIILGTFHSIARRYLAKYGRLIGVDPRFGIADAGDSKAIIERICKRFKLNVEPSVARSWISKRKSAGASSATSAPPTKQGCETSALLTCFEEYQAHLSRVDLLDYDDLLVRCVHLLQEYKSCVSNIQAVLVDEYQDTNGVQYDLMKLFAQERQRITIVGDPDQSIYGWRSADSRNLGRLLRDFQGTKEVALEENYRSSELILSLSLNVIRQEAHRYNKNLVAVHREGLKPVLRKLKTSVAEGEWIVSEIRRITMLSGNMLKLQDIAILLRSASLSRHIESALGKANILYRMVGGTKFFDRKEIKVLLDYLRVIHKPDCNDALARIIGSRRGIGGATVKSLLEEAEQERRSLWCLLWRHCREGRRAKTNIRAQMEQSLNEVLRIMHNLRVKAAQVDQASPLMLVETIQGLVDQLHFKKYLESEYAEDHEGRWASVQELINMAGDMARGFLEAVDEEALPEIVGVEQTRDDDVLGRFLANVALASDAGRDDEGGDETALVTISTIHAAKGLEWPVVFIPSVYTGSIPHARSEDLDEERRLLYVAMTRAQACLYLSWPLYGPGNFGGMELSPFVSSVARMFAPKGPSMDKKVVQKIAKVLGREAPKDKDIYDQLPVNFMPEDDLFPIDPTARDNPNDFKGHNSKAARRPLTACSAQKEQQPWKPDYVTTMGNASQFTMSVGTDSWWTRKADCYPATGHLSASTRSAESVGGKQSAVSHSAFLLVSLAMMIRMMLLAIFTLLFRFVAGVYEAGDKHLIGVGKADITGPVVELGLSGYANLKQVGTGLRQRLYSRAFIIGSVSEPSQRFVYVVLDLQSGDTAVRNGVIERLADLGGGYKDYGHNNVALVGTHSHAGPGGWCNYLLPQIPNLGFDRQSYEAIVNGTVLSIQRAHESMQEGYLEVNDDRLEDGAINRSLHSWLANPKAERDSYPDETDKTLTLLRFQRASDLATIGVLTWFSVHGTSLLGNNTLVAGDNKGVAAWLLEEDYKKQFGGASDAVSVPNFVAGFSQSSVGDTTPNVLGAYCDDGSGQLCDFETSTCADGKSQSCHGRGPEFRALDLGVKSCFEMGQRQFNLAKRLMRERIGQGTHIAATDVKSFHFFHDMRFWEFTTLNGTKAMTCPAALGYSFAAGTSDWPGALDFTQGDGGEPGASPLWRIVSRFIKNPSERQKNCQGVKPILLDVGEMENPYAWAPNIVDIQMFRVGQLFFIISPSEVTTMSGRRWKAAVADYAKNELGVKKPMVVLGGPANTYAHYCATPEEYQVQRYEGASTLYGPHQLDAYINLTVSNMMYLRGGSRDSPARGGAPPDNRHKSISLVPPVIFDEPGFGTYFGKTLQEARRVYRPGSTVNVTFQAANPRNNLRLEETHVAVEKWIIDSQKWVRYRDDSDWFLTFQWRRTNAILGWSEVDVAWDTSGNAETGRYRIRYYGTQKSLISGKKDFEGLSRAFIVEYLG